MCVCAYFCIGHDNALLGSLHFFTFSAVIVVRNMCKYDKMCLNKIERSVLNALANLCHTNSTA